MKLVLIRHARAIERRKSDTAQDDFHRKLTRAGVRRAKLLSPVIHRLIGPVDLLITSPLKRAIATAELLHYQLWKSAKLVELDLVAPDSNPKLIANWLSKKLLLKRKSDLTVVIVGHEPHLSRLAGLLMMGEPISTIELKKCAVAVLEFEGKVSIGEGRLAGLFQPGDLRGMRED